MSHGRKAIDSAVCLDTLGIPWKGAPREWGSIDRNLLHVCNVKGEVFDSSGMYLYRLSPVEKLGEGTFGKVDSFKCVYEHTQAHSIVAIKRPKFPEVDLFMEALFQWRVHDCLEEYGLGFSIPQVYSIIKFKQSGDIWFSMKSYKAMLLSTWCLQNIKKDGKLFTAPLGNILAGITRQTVLEIAAELGYEVVQEFFKPEALEFADSAFFCGTAAEVIGIQSINEYQFPMEWEHSIGAKIQKKYKRRVAFKE
jgi:hypothetical protein